MSTIKIYCEKKLNKLKQVSLHWVRWYTPSIPALGRQKQQVGNSEGNLGCLGRLFPRNKENHVRVWAGCPVSYPTNSELP